MNIILKTGEIVSAKLVRSYGAFEGGMRYIFKLDNGREIRCIKENGEYKELVI